MTKLIGNTIIIFTHLRNVILILVIHLIAKDQSYKFVIFAKNIWNLYFGVLIIIMEIVCHGRGIIHIMNHRCGVMLLGQLNHLF
jgi:hypothetical protein